ncbi:hypothetical protein AB0E78_25940 [Streptomyces sp. NPDC032198]|uniref:hypothetical protein n=1 Tax=Streptomyces sp. NPDC032198 TaxID=3155127 RepID=UPI0033FE5BE7
MDLRAVVSGFKNVIPLPGLPDAWYWSPVRTLNFAGALSADGRRLLQLSGREWFDEELAVATLEFARERESEIFASNPHLGTADGFTPPRTAEGEARTFDVVVGIAPEVHDFYSVDNPALTPHVRLVFPAYAHEFSGRETLDEAITRYRMLRLHEFDRRDPQPFLKMRYANTRTRSWSDNPGRGFTKERILVQELRLLENAPGSFVEFENRHGAVWRVEWHDGPWLLAEWGTAESPPAPEVRDATEPREIELEELLDFAAARLRAQLTGLTG